MLDSRTFHVVERKLQRCSMLTIRVSNTKPINNTPCAIPTTLTMAGSPNPYLSGIAIKRRRISERPSRKAMARRRPMLEVKNLFMRTKVVEVLRWDAIQLANTESGLLSAIHRNFVKQGGLLFFEEIIFQCHQHGFVGSEQFAVEVEHSGKVNIL